MSAALPYHTCRFAAAFYCYFTYMPSFLAANVPGMSRALSLGSTMVHLSIVMMVAWATGYFCDKGMPRMTVSGVVFIIAAATLAPASLAMRAGGIGAAWVLHLWFSVLVGVIGGLLAVSMCPLYPPEVRTSGMNFAHQVCARVCACSITSHVLGTCSCHVWTACQQNILFSPAQTYCVPNNLPCRSPDAAVYPSDRLHCFPCIWNQTLS